MAEQKRACIIFVDSTRSQVAHVRSALEANGYKVSETEVCPDEATAAQSGTGQISESLRICIEGADLCIFLVPEEAGAAEQLGGGVGAGKDAGKRVIGVLVGSGTAVPQVFDDLADCIVRVDSERLPDAINGEEVWEAPDGSTPPPRKPKRVKCQ